MRGSNHFARAASYPAHSPSTTDSTDVVRAGSWKPLTSSAGATTDSKRDSQLEAPCLQAHCPNSSAKFRTSPKPNKLNAVPAKPVSKEEAARKRGFNELIGLSLLSDEDDIPSPQKGIHIRNSPTMSEIIHPMYESTRHPVPGVTQPETVPAVYSDQMPNIHLDTEPQRHNFLRSESYSSNGSTQRHTVASTPVDISAKTSASHLDVVKPIDRKKALRMPTYNVKTIARDVLLAVGKHPEMRPLNAHLEILKTTFHAVNDTSDLSTFRWDLVDPGQPPKGTLTGFYNDTANADEEVSKDDHEARRQAGMALVARPSLQAMGHGYRPERLVNPSSTQVAPKQRCGRPPRYSIPTSSSIPRNLGDEEGNPSFNHRPPGTIQVGGQSVVQSVSTAGISMDETPPLQQSSKPQHDVVYYAQSSPGKSGYPAFCQDTQDGSLIKKTVRPVGWRRAIHSPEAGKANTTHQIPSGKPSGSPMASLSRRHEDRLDKLKYFVYECRWERCKAQLHNLETLRRHIDKLHKRQDAEGNFECSWEGCINDEAQLRHGHQSTRHKFSNKSIWWTHIELIHLGPIAWKLGDGPASGCSDAHDSEAYLSDSHGRQVTPRVMTLELGGSSTTPKLLPVRRGPGRSSKQVSAEEEAREAQALLLRKKQQIGPGMDRGGVRLATERRRMGLLDDEDFEEVVDGE